MGDNVCWKAFQSVVSLVLGLLFATPLSAQSMGNLDPANSAPPKVVDARGNFVGWPRASTYIFIWSNGSNSGTSASYSNLFNGVERNINGVWVLIPTGPGGFAVNLPGFSTVYYKSSNCSGIGYMDANSLPPIGFVFTKPPSITQPTLAYPGTPVELITPASQLPFGGTCHSGFNIGAILAGPVQSIPVSSFGLVPPFTVK
jgi:hypothetical protein